MRILFLHGWTSVPGGRKPTFLADHGHDILNPALPDEDFEEAVRIAQAEYDQHHPDVIVGSSRGGAVAMNIESGDTPLVLLCPAWEKWGSAKTVKKNVTILHSRADAVVPFEDSEELVANSGLPNSALIEVGNDHRLADPEPLAKMLEACGMSSQSKVRNVYLVGESLPLTKSGNQRVARSTESLPEHLVSLDPRHGVFPNLVMKPLFAATVFAFRDKPTKALELLKEFEFVVCDEPDRRFNVFEPKITDQDNPLSNRFVFDSSDLGRRIRELDTANDLWFVFGHQTVSGLLMWLLESDAETTRSRLKGFLKRFVDTAFSVAKTNKLGLSVPTQRPTSASGRVGLVHRLCTEHDSNGDGVTSVLAKVIEEMNVLRRFPNEEIQSRLRAFVPLMHNEAYQDGPHPTGNAQAHFVRNASNSDDSVLYWQVMGRAAACRCLDRFVGEENG